MKIRLILLIFLIFTICAYLCGCTVIHGKLKVEIKDKNGDDTALAVLNDEDIRSENYKSYCFIYGYSGDDVKSFPDGDGFRDNSKVEVLAKTPYSGVGVIMRTYGRDDTVIFTVASELTKGNLRIVLLDDAGQLIHDFAIGGEDSVTVTGALDRTYEIRIAGESAEFRIKASHTMVYAD